MERKISVCAFFKIETLRKFSQSFWLNTNTRKNWLTFFLLKGKMFSYISHSHTVWNPLHTEKVRDIISCLMWVFTHNLCKSSAVQRGEGDSAAVFFGIITVNITVFGSDSCACVICHDDHTGMLKKLVSSRDGRRHENEAGLCVEREQRHQLILPASSW